MRKNPGFTMVEQAVVLVPEFEKVVRKLEQQVTLRGQSSSTLQNYIRRIALFVTHFQRLPEQIETEEVNLHSLRNSYATHLLEQGLNIVTLKELLGHAEITTTMIYLHVAQCPLIKAHSLLDRLYRYPDHAAKV